MHSATGPYLAFILVYFMTEDKKAVESDIEIPPGPTHGRNNGVTVLT